MILDQKLQRMLNDSKIAQLNSERPLHQTAVRFNSPEKKLLADLLGEDKALPARWERPIIGQGGIFQ